MNKTTFPAKNFFGPILSRIIEYEKISEQFMSVNKVLWQLFSKVKDLLFRTYDVDENSFSKKATFPMEGNFGHFFLVLTNMAELR